MTLMFLCLSWLLSVYAQSSPVSPTPTLNVSLSLTTSSYTTTTQFPYGGHTFSIPTVISTVFNVTLTSNHSATATHTPSPYALDTRLDPAFGILGTLLILTGLPSAFWGHKNRWTSFFLIGFYTLSLTCLVLILKFGVLPAINPPSKTLRGMFVLSCTVAGASGGAVAIFFWKGAKFFIGAWGGFAFALWLQCFRDGGLVAPIGVRWIFFIACAVVGFVLCTIPKLHYHVLLASTAIVGASVFMLGVDCFTTANLKEFYLWNIGFRSLFPKYVNHGNTFPVSQTMQIELGLMGAITLTGMAVQMRILSVLQRKLREIAAEQRRRDEEAEHEAASRFADVLKEREEWEKEHPTHDRKVSGLSTVPLMAAAEPYSTGEGRRNSGVTLTSGSHDHPASALSHHMYDDPGRVLPKPTQSPGALPLLELGNDIHDDVPRSFMLEDKGDSKGKRDREKIAPNPEMLRSRENLIAEIQTIRQSIEALKVETSSAETSRHPSLTSRRTLSHDASSFFLPAAHPRPPRQAPRPRVQSLELSALSQAYVGESIGRPTSAPLRDNDWDSYVRDRKLLQPPAGVTPPIATTPVHPRMSIPPAVNEALAQRRMRESLLRRGDVHPSSSSSPVPRDTSSEDIPLSKIPVQPSPSQQKPVAVLPPTRKPSGAIATPVPQRPVRTRTFEELAERHREKMRDMQAPLAQAERQQAELNAARDRWDRSNAVEKEVVNRRLAEKAAAYTKEAERRRKSDDLMGKVASRRSMTMSGGGVGGHKHSRSLSADKLTAFGGGTTTSKRMSMMKVEDWQKYQQEARTDRPPEPASSRRDSRPMKGEGGGIPFPRPPQRARHPSGYGRQQRVSNVPRDPPN